MQYQTEGLIIKESVVGESDRIVTVLTRDEGLIRAFVRKAKASKSRGTSATALLCYSKLTIYKGKEKNMIGDARPIKLFFELRNDIAALSLAQYFCELAGRFVPEGVNSEEYLRLILNALYFLSENKKPHALLKAAVEMRILSLSGYMPNLIACDNCGEFLTEKMYFDIEKGILLCSDCGKITNTAIECSKGIITALRHTIYSDFEKLFAFSLSDEGLLKLSEVSERYVVSSIGYKLKTLDFYNAVKE